MYNYGCLLYQIMEVAHLLRNKKQRTCFKRMISLATLAMMWDDGTTVLSDVLVKICAALYCMLDDILVAEGENRNRIYKLKA